LIVSSIIGIIQGVNRKNSL
jgi:hypothetical protein